MIQSFKHRGLKRLYERGDRSQVRPDHLSRIEDILTRLDAAASPEAMRLPGYRLHRLKGDLKDYWSVRLSDNWRIIFRHVGGDAFDVHMIDHH